MRSLSSIAVIPDGNRRYARSSGLNSREAYVKGFDKVKSVVEWAREEGVESATFWALSLDNFTKRSKTELDVVLSLLEDRIDEFLSEGSRDARLNFFGRLDLLPEKLSEKFLQAEKQSSSNQGPQLNFAVAYNGRDELFHAAKKLAEDYKRGEAILTPEEFEKRLYYRDAPDLVIRTGSTNRLSGFLPWQAEYSELFFSQQLWPEFSRDEFNRAIEFYKNSENRKGR
ncbi:di-trans,poly-cis-decaprenylcistransferase [Candidatus Micrarchaeota archaeon CG10_big_fil_rev_8_21_14_0_10_54_18]|nr:MAG: di-trans,poly-cis-decaprenylcistransferase [Candidatus Micrarchaeota archaeon CG1_02_55_41]PIO03743.1 MAG: di-trans,poly-cis-decaprenylcistransferase [Candidatus Micrarchaeota archaeon CG09_land_8_20_14_0_10_55_25]PJD01417.1 MAG: di-trans,poly-cis-decaprenylcistransferase [Candidatus Micrarchaeota archaeon CG10_big_fil_rev_8_21_14_0_10_54_18]